jgi:mono/diheme cytochrome c family protein
MLRLLEAAMNRMLFPCVIATIVLASPWFPLFAQSLESISIASGRQVATAMCANCHEISPTSNPKTVIGPKFDDIANLPSTTALSLKVFLRSTHNQMPNFILPSADTDDVIAYILSLKR